MQAHDFLLILLLILVGGRIFAEIGRVSGIFEGEIYEAIIMVIILTTMIPPLLMKMVYTKMQ